MPQSMKEELNSLSSGGFNDPDITLSNSSSDEDDDALSYFAKLAED